MIPILFTITLYVCSISINVEVKLPFLADLRSVWKWGPLKEGVRMSYYNKIPA